MAWIKRNLIFVIIVAVGLGATGFCGYLLYSALEQNKADSDKYLSDKSSLETLQKKRPFPDQQNIKAAELDAERVRAFLTDFHKPFAAFPTPPKLDDRRFKEYLQNSVMHFGLEASNAGVGLPPGYAFAFSQQMNVLNYSSDCIAPWMQQLTEINAILHILYNAKINYLEKIKRPTVPGEDVMGDDYLQIGMVTNTTGVVTPYMVNFRAFSAEIANVLAGVAASSNCLIIKTIYVTPSREPLPSVAELQAPTPPPMLVPQYRRYQPPPEAPLNPFMQQDNSASRYRERRPMGPIPQMQYAPAYQEPPAPTGPVTILTETPLFVTIYIDVVKLKALETPAVAAKPLRRGGR
jgi:hypothetical protein